MDIMIVLVVISLTLCAVVYLHLAHITSVRGVEYTARVRNIFIFVCIYVCMLSLQVVEALSFTVVLMVASIPLAIEIVTTTTLALGSKELSKHGRLGHVKNRKFECYACFLIIRGDRDEVVCHRGYGRHGYPLLR